MNEFRKRSLTSKTGMIPITRVSGLQLSNTETSSDGTLAVQQQFSFNKKGLIGQDPRISHELYQIEGIPETDLSKTVKIHRTSANTALQKNKSVH